MINEFDTSSAGNVAADPSEDTRLEHIISTLPPELWDTYYKEQEELLTNFVNKLSQQEADAVEEERKHNATWNQ